MNVAIVAGDGIGPEVIPAARAVIEIIRPETSFFDVELGYGRWQRTGEAITDEDISLLSLIHI